MHIPSALVAVGGEAIGSLCRHTYLRLRPWLSLGSICLSSSPAPRLARSWTWVVYSAVTGVSGSFVQIVLPFRSMATKRNFPASSKLCALFFAASRSSVSNRHCVQTKGSLVAHTSYSANIVILDTTLGVVDIATRAPTLRVACARWQGERSRTCLPVRRSLCLPFQRRPHCAKAPIHCGIGNPEPISSRAHR